ncbi:MAG: GNAT family N-acetyltransferase [Chloroflexota bacterium]
MAETDKCAVVIRRVRADEAAAFRAFRLRALADAPDAFSTSLAESQAMPDSYWEQRAERGAAGIETVTLVAADPVSDAWMGMTASFLEDGESEPGQIVALVVSVWVAPEARRRGLARRLLDTAADWAKSRGARALRLWVTETNHRARALYREAGLVETGVVRPLRSNPSLLELQLGRNL